jgi:hypothetical protein
MAVVVLVIEAVAAVAVVEWVLGGLAIVPERVVVTAETVVRREPWLRGVVMGGVVGEVVAVVTSRVAGDRPGLDALTVGGVVPPEGVANKVGVGVVLVSDVEDAHMGRSSLSEQSSRG